MLRRHCRGVDPGGAKAGYAHGSLLTGGYDWTFNSGPISTKSDYDTVKPKTAAYGKYVDAQYRELIHRYHPAVLWNDIDYPKTGNPREIEAEYYREFQMEWSMTASASGMQTSHLRNTDHARHQPRSGKSAEGWVNFGYNRAEGEEQTIQPDKLIYLLVDIVSKNGNLLLDVGPEADGTIPQIQLDRLKALGAWLKQNGGDLRDAALDQGGRQDAASRCALYPEGRAIYAVLMGKPGGGSVTLKDISLPDSDCDHPAGPARCADLAKARRRRDGELSARASWRVRVRP